MYEVTGGSQDETKKDEKADAYMDLGIRMTQDAKAEFMGYKYFVHPALHPSVPLTLFKTAPSRFVSNLSLFLTKYVQDSDRAKVSIYIVNALATQYPLFEKINIHSLC